MCASVSILANARRKCKISVFLCSLFAHTVCAPQYRYFDDVDRCDFGVPMGSQHWQGVGHYAYDRMDAAIETMARICSLRSIDRKFGLK